MQVENEKKVEAAETKKVFFKKEYLLPLSIFVSAVIVGGALIYTSQPDKGKSAELLAQNSQGQNVQGVTIDENSIIPQEGIELPITWADLGAQMVEKGVINGSQFESLYTQRGGMDEEMKKILYGQDNGKIKMTPQNSGFLLNVLWALGLGNKN
ncbi:MAG: hypothetical protein UX59_C0004G0001, partial [Microgenomates group bacterium GW2011_GWA1_46_7]